MRPQIVKSQICHLIDYLVMIYDVLIIGAGIEGSSTAYNLVKNGSKRILLLEQVDI